MAVIHSDRLSRGAAALVFVFFLWLSTPARSVSVSSVVTPQFFNGIKNQATGNCPGKNFFTRSAFLSAASSFPNFGNLRSTQASKQEIAAFFAHVSHETGRMCHIVESGTHKSRYCDPTNKQFPCARGKSYYGRGPLQLSWNYNYGAAGKSLNFDGLHHPEIVATNPVISFKTALWFWMNNVHQILASHKGFGATIRAINSMECNGGNSAAVNSRVTLYKAYCSQLGVSHGPSLTC